jgi:cell division transport system permease protein
VRGRIRPRVDGSVNSWINQHADTLVRTLLRLVRSPIATLFNVAVIGIALALPLGFYVVLDNIRQVAARLPAQPEVSVFLALDATRADAARIEGSLRKATSIAELRFVPRDEALAAMRKSGEFAGLLEGLPGNPLPDAFVVRLAAADPEGLEKLRAEAGKWPKVDRVQVDSAWARRLQAGLKVARLATAILAGMLAFALLAVTFNTIRLQILTQREEIEVCRLIGATNAFIRRPFLYFGTLQGLLGGGAALGFVAAGVALLNAGLVEVGHLYGADLILRLPGLADAGAVLGFAGALGWIGAWLSSSRHLWTRNRA